MSVKAMNWAWSLDLQEKPSEKLCLMAMADNADDFGVCWPSNKTLARKVGVSTRTIIRHTKWLLDVGLIEKDSRIEAARGQRSNIYRLRLDRTLSGESTDTHSDNLSPPVRNNTPSDSMSPPDDTAVTPPVTDCHRGSDTGDTPPVTQVSPLEPSCESPREPEEIFTAPEAEFVDDEAASADAADGVLESDPDDDVYVTKRGRQLRGELLERFEQFWDAFDYRKGKAEAADAWLAKVPWTKSPEQNNALLSRILLAAEFEAMQRPAKVAMKITPIYPEGWLSGRRWEDESVDLAANAEAGTRAGKRDAITAAIMDIHDTDW